MKIIVLLLVISSCTCFVTPSFFLRPEINNVVVLPGIDGTLYEFEPEVPPLPDWLALYPYERYPTTKHRSKRQTDWGVKASLNIPLGGGSSRPSWSFGGFVTHSNPTFNARIDAGLQGNFGQNPNFSLSGQVNGTG